MNKKIYALAALAAVALPAWAAEVYSSNIVGYQKISLVAGYNMLAPQFMNVGANTITRDIASVGILDSSMEGYDADYFYANEMLVWDSAGQTYISYGWAGTSGTDIDGDATYDNQWLDAGTEVTTDTIDVGQGFWVKAATAGTMTVSGQVANSDVIPEGGLEVDLVVGYNMIANPYPKAVPVASFGTLDSSMEGYDADYFYANEMLVWDPAGQTYISYGWAGTSGTDIDGDSTYDNQWLDAGTEVTEDTIPAGASVWIKAATAGTITFPEL